MNVVPFTQGTSTAPTDSEGSSNSGNHTESPLDHSVPSAVAELALDDSSSLAQPVGDDEVGEVSDAFEGCQLDTEADAYRCAICLDSIVPEDTAIIPQCGHSEHCINCLLTWALYHEAPKCPQCKEYFHYLYVHRTLDGEVSDWPLQESVALLLRAHWFTRVVSAQSISSGRRAAAMDSSIVQGDHESAGGNDALAYLWDDAEDEADDDGRYHEEVLIRRSRKGRHSGDIVLGNRPYGRGGFMSAGRSAARPVQQPNKQKGKQQQQQQQQSLQQSGNGKRNGKNIHQSQVDCSNVQESERHLNNEMDSSSISRPVSATKAKRQAKQEAKLAKERAKAERRRQELGLNKEQQQSKGKESRTYTEVHNALDEPSSANDGAAVEKE